MMLAMMAWSRLQPIGSIDRPDQTTLCLRRPVIDCHRRHLIALVD